MALYGRIKDIRQLLKEQEQAMLIIQRPIQVNWLMGYLLPRPFLPNQPVDTVISMPHMR